MTIAVIESSCEKVNSNDKVNGVSQVQKSTQKEIIIRRLIDCWQWWQKKPVYINTNTGICRLKTNALWFLFKTLSVTIWTKRIHKIYSKQFVFTTLPIIRMGIKWFLVTIINLKKMYIGSQHIILWHFESWDTITKNVYTYMKKNLTLPQQNIM